MKIMITGGSGFIGSALCRHLALGGEDEIVNVDALTYASTLTSLKSLEKSPHYRFAKEDIRNRRAMFSIMNVHDIDAVVHLAAESHVDRSIGSPRTFIDTNIGGTYELLEAAREYWQALPASRRALFRFHHVSTDEVFGDLPFDAGLFSEHSAYAPSSPYSASKAASDHLVRAWGRTYGLPFVVSNCSNNFGPFQFPEKLIPLIILNALHGKRLPVYAKGQNVRDWLYVEDHASALEMVLKRGRPGESYNIGGNAERTNISVVQSVCALLDARRPLSAGGRYASLINFVSDRPGHDQRYAVDTYKINSELGWSPRESFETGLEKTVDWYLENKWWWRPLLAGRDDGGSSDAP
jgi:dTDP-glucose 4,6-dehydratase